MNLLRLLIIEKLYVYKYDYLEIDIILFMI